MLVLSCRECAGTAGSAGSHVRQGGVGRVTRRSVSVFSPASDLHSFTQHTESSVKYYDLPNMFIYSYGSGIHS